MTSLIVKIEISLLIWFGLLHQVTSWCYDKNTDYEYVNRDCRLTHVPLDISDETTDIDLSHNEINVLDGGVFVHLTQCINMQLSYNELTHLGSEMLDGLQSLKHLWLDNNGLGEIDTGAFSELIQCTKLYLNNNKLTLLKLGIFEGLGSLKWLFLEYNNITNIETESFSGLELCTFLSLEHNKLTHIRKGMFDGLRSLEVLQLSSNKIKQIEVHSFSDLTRCTKLLLSDNELMRLYSGMFEGLHSLRSLELYSNIITDIQMRSFWHLTKCVELYLSSNKLIHLWSGMFQGLQSLNWLWLNNNSISEIESGTFLHLTYCTKLHLSGNKLAHLNSGVFDGLQSLEELQLDNNRIFQIEAGTLLPLKHCTKLRFNNNKLNHLLTGMFHGLRSLKWLSLQNNNLSHIEPGTFADLINLQTLLLKDNKLTYLDENAFQTSINTPLTLSLSANPLWCNNKMCWIKEAENDSNIIWQNTAFMNKKETPFCVNFPGLNWNSVILNCKDTGVLSTNNSDNQNAPPPTIPSWYTSNLETGGNEYVLQQQSISGDVASVIMLAILLLFIAFILTRVQFSVQDVLQRKHLMMLLGKLDQSHKEIIIPDILNNLDFKPIKSDVKKKDARYLLEEWLDTQLNRKKARERFRHALLKIFFMTQDTPHENADSAEDEQDGEDKIMSDHLAKNQRDGKDIVDGCINIRKVVNCMHKSDLKKFASKSLNIEHHKIHVAFQNNKNDIREMAYHLFLDWFNAQENYQIARDNLEKALELWLLEGK